MGTDMKVLFFECEDIIHEVPEDWNWWVYFKEVDDDFYVDFNNPDPTLYYLSLPRTKKLWCEDCQDFESWGINGGEKEENEKQNKGYVLIPFFADKKSRTYFMHRLGLDVISTWKSTEEEEEINEQQAKSFMDSMDKIFNEQKPPYSSTRFESLKQKKEYEIIRKKQEEEEKIKAEERRKEAIRLQFQKREEENEKLKGTDKERWIRLVKAGVPFSTVPEEYKDELLSQLMVELELKK